MPRKIGLNVLFDKKALDDISSISEDLGISKGQFIRDAVGEWIHGYKLLEKDKENKKLKDRIENKY